MESWKGVGDQSDGGRSSLQARLWERVSVSAKFFGRLQVLVVGLLCMLLCGQRIDLLTGFDEAAVVLLLDLGSNVV